MTLAQFWFILIAVLWTGFFVLEGFDLGVGMLHGIVGRDEAGRRAVVNTIGPLWDGNEAWLVRDHVLRLLPGAGAALGFADGPRHLVRVPRQARQRPLAAHLGWPAGRRQPARPPADRHRAG